MRIFKHKFYVIHTIPGISGFQQWDKREVYMARDGKFYSV